PVRFLWRMPLFLQKSAEWRQPPSDCSDSSSTSVLLVLLPHGEFLHNPAKSHFLLSTEKFQIGLLLKGCPTGNLGSRDPAAASSRQDSEKQGAVQPGRFWCRQERPLLCR